MVEVLVDLQIDKEQMRIRNKLKRLLRIMENQTNLNLKFSNINNRITIKTKFKYKISHLLNNKKVNQVSEENNMELPNLIKEKDDLTLILIFFYKSSLYQ